MWSQQGKHLAPRFVSQNISSERQQQQKYAVPLKIHGTYRNEEYRDNGSACQGRNEDKSSFQVNLDKKNLCYEHDGWKLAPSHLQEDDGNVVMRDFHKYHHIRYTPYGTQNNKRSTEGHNEDHMLITMWRDRKPPKTGVWENTQDETMESWFKVTIPYGRKYDKTWLMNSIQSHCSVRFSPVDFHYVKNRAQFFVQDASTASALKDVSYKICDEKNQKICVFVSPSAVPYSVWNKLKPEQMEQLKLTMNKRYNVYQQALDLQKLRFDPDLVGHDIDIILNRRNCMAATLQIIERDFPELLSLNLRNNKLYRLDGLSDIIEKAPTVKILNLSKNELKSVWELDKVKGLKLEELWLDGNPLCRTFPDRSAYVSAIQDYFPKLLRLDGQDLYTPIIIDSDIPELIKPCTENYKGSETLKSLVLKFLEQYYLIYDSGDRKDLLAAYHDEACFSLTISFNLKHPAPGSLYKYFKDNRNMKKLKDPYLRRRLLKHTKRDVVNSLSVLPKTQHDLSSFMVDMCIQTDTMLCFSVNGVFKEVEGKSKGSVRAFTRIFITIPGSNSSLYITNDDLIVRNASPNEIQSSFSIPVATPCSSSMPTLSQEQQEMVQAFSMQSGMKLAWSQKCLEDNEWNYTRAGQVFTMLQTEGKIPQEAFREIP